MDEPDIHCVPDDTRTQHHPRCAGRTYGDAHGIYRKHRRPDWNPWHPFKNARDFELGRWMMESNLTKTAIDDYLQRGLDDDRCASFNSADELWVLFENLEFGFGSQSWTSFEIESGTLWTRNLLQCIQLLLGHLPFEEHTVYGPMRIFDSSGRRIYNEIYTGDWWWDIQDTVPEGGTVVPLLFGSDKTHLTNFSGDKAAWPLYMTLGNIKKEIRRQSSKRAWVLVALLPVPPKNPRSGEIHTTWHTAIDKVLSPIKDLDLGGPGYSWDCADGQVRQCYPIIAAWIADYMEYVVLARLIGGFCPVCEIPKDAMGHESGILRTGDDYPMRDKHRYQRALDSGNSQCLKEYGLQSEVNPLWDFAAGDPYRLWQPDILHLLNLGIVKTTMEWVIGYMEDCGLLDRFNLRFKSMAPYPGFARFKRSYSEVSSWQGKEMRTMMKFLLAITGPLLADRIKSVKCEEAKALQCVRSLCELHLVVGQWSHSEYTLELLQELLQTFYVSKSAFRDQRATDARKKRFNMLWERKVKEAEKRGWAQARRDREYEKLRAEVFHFQFPKMHLLSHISESIRRMGSPDNFSTDVSELLHVEMVKEAYRSTNRVNFEEQMLWYNDRNTGLAYMIQTLEYLALRGSFDSDTARTLRMCSRDERRKSTRWARQRHADAGDTSSHLTLEIGLEPRTVPSYTPIAVPEARARAGIGELKRQTELAGRVRTVKALSLREASLKFGINDLPVLFHQQMVAIWGSQLTDRILGPGDDFADKVRIEVYNSVANFYQPFQRPLEVQKRFLRSVQSGDGKRPAITHDVWVRVKLDRTEDTFQGRKVCTPLLYFSYTPPAFATKLRGPAGERVAVESRQQCTRGRNHVVWVPQMLELAVLVGYRYKNPSGRPNRFHGCVEVEQDGRDRSVAEVGSIEGPVQLVEVNEARRSRKTWIVNNHIDLETYNYVY